MKIATRMRDRSERIARRLQLQLEPVVASDDRLSAREIFESYSGDRELDGIWLSELNSIDTADTAA